MAARKRPRLADAASLLSIGFMLTFVWQNGELWCSPQSSLGPRHSPVESRRRLLEVAGFGAGSWVACGVQAAEETNAGARPAPWKAEVGDGASFGSIGAALSAAPLDAAAISIMLRPGTFRERLQISNAGTPVTIEAVPRGQATLTWETDRPYEAALELAPGAKALVRGLNIRHAGKSVANNYAIYSNAAQLELEECDVTSSTGAGVAAEGGSLVLRSGAVHDCARQGLILFGPMLGGDPLRVKACGTKFLANGRYLGDNDAIRGPFDGILARNGVEAELTGVSVDGSGAVGVAAFEDAQVLLVGSSLERNSKGATRSNNGGEIVLRTAGTAAPGRC